MSEYDEKDVNPYELEEDENEKQIGVCKYCSEEVYWMKTRKGKSIPVDTDSVDLGYKGLFDKSLGHECHIVNCEYNNVGDDEVFM